MAMAGEPSREHGIADFLKSCEGEVGSSNTNHPTPANQGLQCRMCGVTRRVVHRRDSAQTWRARPLSLGLPLVGT
jgi:hypothetical protein